MEKEIICIVCPKGCKITARIRCESGADIDEAQEPQGKAGQKVKGPEDRYEISGHSCTRGYEYAVSECINPVRTLTTTIRLLYEDPDAAHNPEKSRNHDGVRNNARTLPALVPVKSSAPLPKGLLKECMKVVNSAAARPPVRIGDVIIRDILGTGADIIATANITGEECKWRNGSSSRSTRGRQVQGL